MENSLPVHEENSLHVHEENSRPVHEENSLPALVSMPGILNSLDYCICYLMIVYNMKQAEFWSFLFPLCMIASSVLHH